MTEIWKDVPGFEDFYQVSNTGKVRSKDRLVNRNGGLVLLASKEMKQKTDKDGYYSVSFSIDHKKYHNRVHRLVLSAFIGPAPEDKPLGMHLDDNVKNNRLDNLQWGNNSENVRQSIDRGRKPPSKPWKGKTGKDNHGSKLLSQYSLSGEKIATFHGIKEAARLTGVNRSRISSCCRGQGHTAGGFKWAFE